MSWKSPGWAPLWAGPGLALGSSGKAAWLWLLSPTGARVEEFLYEKLDRKVPSRVTNGELLAQYMAEAASELGPTTPYGEPVPTAGRGPVSGPDLPPPFFPSFLWSCIYTCDAWIHSPCKYLNQQR